MPKTSYTSKNLNRQTNRNPIQKILKNTNKPQNDSKNLEQKTKWVYHEAIRTEGIPCNKLCNGIQRIRVYPICVNNQQLVDENLCPQDKKLKVKYIDKPCNTNCKLR